MSKKFERGGPLVSSVRNVTRKLRQKTFWFSSLGQMIQFGTMKFCRTFKNYFDQFVWIEKRVTIIVAFHFIKRRLKTRIDKIHDRYEIERILLTFNGFQEI